MAHTILNSTGNFLSSPGVPCPTNNNFLLRHNSVCKLHRKLLPAERYRLPLSTSLNLFPQFWSGYILQPRGQSYKALASGTDVALEESEVTQVDAEAANGTETTGESSENPKANTPRVNRSKPARKSDMPPVKNEELVPGATFTGKVRSIQPFGAFVDFGAFTDGLVHVSQLSDSFVKDVANIVTVGQEVKVRLLEANMDSGRISLSMREKDDSNKQQQRRSAPVNGDKSRPPRKTGPRNTQKKEEVKKISKFVKGQDLLGTVKNLTRAGAFISLPEGEEGFLPTSEEADEGFISMTTGASSLEINQEVNVRVLRITRGQITLTMKKEEDAAFLDSNLNQGVVHKATNPFALAFHNNKEISSFLDERKKSDEPQEDASLVTDNTNLEIPEGEVVADDTSSVNGTLAVESDQNVAKEDSDVSIDGFLSPATSKESTDEVSSDATSVDKEQEEHDSVLPSEAQSDSSFSSQPLSFTSDEEPIQSAADIESGGQANEELTPSEGKDDVDTNVAAQTTLSPDISEEVTEAALDSSSEIVENIRELDSKASSEKEIASDSIEDSSLAITENESESVGDITNEPVLSEIQEEAAELKVEDQAETIESSSDATLLASSNTEESNTSNSEIDPSVIEAISSESPVDEQITVNGVHPETSLDEGTTLEIPEQAEPVTPNAPEASQKGATSAISPALVKQLREETGAGMMDCKKALSETGGDIVKAQEYLRKKGLASADKKASRATAEGRIGSYIHDSRIGVLIEVNCETDFVSRGNIFKELAEDLAMQVAACPQVEYVNVEDIPTEIVEKEREIEMQKEDLLSKPEQIRSKIVDGRISKRLGELALLEQPFIKDDKVLVKDWVKQTISTIGENMKVKRFVRYNLGEGLQKKNIDFAAEVAAQTAAKSNPVTPVKQEPAAAETKEAVESTEKVAVSAALVKQLREETGAGMMDCKKALSETGGDFEKAQEYLRKKGLSAADKKSSRIAAEGRIGSYIHDSRIGVLVELNCETDFVGRSQAFKELVDDLAMQAVACPQVQYVSIEDIPQDIVDKEKQLEMQREDLQSKPENIREKIVEGRITKRLGELALLEQPFIKNDSLLVKDLVKQTVAALGENIKVRRFARFTLGETAKIEA